LLGALAMVGLVGVPPANASTDGGTTATVTVAVRSITVSPSTTAFDTCSGQGTLHVITFPDAVCTTSGSHDVTITNGTAPGHIDVFGADAIPADNGTHWTLCTMTASPPLCTGPSGAPGPDQFNEIDQNASTINVNGPSLTTASPGQCDTGFSSGCVAGSSQQVSEDLQLEGPSSSTDASATFTTVWTWTAVP
jgi:hypothetical protein